MFQGVDFKNMILVQGGVRVSTYLVVGFAAFVYGQIFSTKVVR
ncbi:hypothetical protein [[Clostridium] polysaccharolyticum]|jgi:hypothetical protein|uniref:Uncharacterized protein n=1 Tax=[Clostridium] polysaccharolyticum TaxID=29364 RepID=A0A1I0CT00_9FIRM|nr:hypothetical protein [[Clostridium] polysaccharolyticum]SET22923.1 hypothetical protein SAMN04487772_11155 [[Clostridium] polysaccharolyticum]